jgi:hypothetical protein
LFPDNSTKPTLPKVKSEDLGISRINTDAPNIGKVKVPAVEEAIKRRGVDVLERQDDPEK